MELFNYVEHIMETWHNNPEGMTVEVQLRIYPPLVDMPHEKIVGVVRKYLSEFDLESTEIRYWTHKPGEVVCIGRLAGRGYTYVHQEEV